MKIANFSPDYGDTLGGEISVVAEMIANRGTWKKGVVAATTGNITIATALNAGDSIDGVTLAAGDRVLVWQQSTGSQNGVYVVGATPARAPDFDASDEIMGALVPVLAGGSTLGGKLYRNTNTTTITLETTAITFVEFTSTASAGTYVLTTEGGQETINARGALGATETIDPTLGNIFTGTLDANLTLTLDPPVGSGGATLEGWFTQSGGPWTITNAASGGGTVQWDGGVTPTLPSTGTFRIVYERIPATTNDWVADLVGAGSDLTIEDEGTPLATAATSLDFVGAGVTATGAGAAKTITIPGDAAHIADATDAHDASAISFSPTGTIAATDVQAAIAEVASEAGTSGDKFVVDPGAPSYAGTGPTVTLTSVFGITSGGAPYYNAANVTSGEEAALMRDPATGSYFLRDYNF